MRKILIGLLLLVSSLSFGQDYFFSNSGDDSNNGTSSATPWKTLSKLNTEIAAGTFNGKIVAFKRGDIFSGVTITISSENNITFVAYGTGNKPVISMANTVSDSWSVFSGNIYEVTLSQSPSHILYLFKDGIKQTLARYPNTGYRKLTSVTSNTVLADNTLTNPDGYWDGATLCVHTNDWSFGQGVVSNFANSGGVITLASGTDYESSTGYGYFFQNATNCIDVAGEWSYDGTKLYYDGDPSGFTFTFTTENNVVSIDNSDNISFTGIKFEQSTYTGIDINNSDNVVIDSCDFRFLNKAIYSKFSDYDTVMNCDIDSIALDGIVFETNKYGAIEGNRVFNVGNIPGEGNDIDYGGHLKGIYLGLQWVSTTYVGCDNILVAKNHLKYIGGNGIHFTVSNNITVEKNKVELHSLVKGDGGGIYSWHDSDSSFFSGSTHYVANYDSCNVRYNYVTTDLSKIDKSWVPTRTGSADSIYPAYGIYIDDGNFRVNVEHNVSMYNRFGIFLHNSGHARIEDNITYHNKPYGIYCRNNLGSTMDTVRENKFLRNTFVLYYDGEDGYYYNAYTMYLDAAFNNTWDYNYWAEPFGQYLNTGHVIAGFNDDHGSFTYTLAEWQADLGGANSAGPPFTYSESGLTNRDDLVLVLYNFSDTLYQVTNSFQNGYSYYDMDDVQVTSRELQPYESVVYFVRPGDNTYGSSSTKVFRYKKKILIYKGKIIK